MIDFVVYGIYFFASCTVLDLDAQEVFVLYPLKVLFREFLFLRTDNFFCFWVFNSMFGV